MFKLRKTKSRFSKKKMNKYCIYSVYDVCLGIKLLIEVFLGEDLHGE